MAKMVAWFKGLVVWFKSLRISQAVPVVALCLMLVVVVFGAVGSCLAQR